MAGQSKRKQRIDLRLVDEGFASSRAQAQAMIMAGQVLVGEKKVEKSGQTVVCDAPIRIIGDPNRYVSRGGLKLEGALDDFSLNVEGRVALDVGASTGGFTDCLLQRGVRHVYALDVGHGQLAWRLQQDSRVTRLDGINSRFFATDARRHEIREVINLVTMDVSFISLTKAFLGIDPVLTSAASGILLIKPQFELSQEKVGKGGIVTEDQYHREAVEAVERALDQLGWQSRGVTPSKLRGATGNQEFFLLVKKN